MAIRRCVYCGRKHEDKVTLCTVAEKIPRPIRFIIELIEFIWIIFILIFVVVVGVPILAIAMLINYIVAKTTDTA